MSGIERGTFGTTADGSPVERFTLTNGDGTRLVLSAFGATAVQLWTRDRRGELADVVLGYDEVAGYEANAPYLGCTVGRVANRISGGHLEIEGEVYQLALNEPPSLHLHGGAVGFDKRLWRAEPLSGQPSVRFTYISPDGEENYPGEVATSVTYTLTEAGGVLIEYEATTDRVTVVNLTNHSYFNLSGHGAGTVRGHELIIHANAITEGDADGVPTGPLAPVADTPLDFRDWHTVGERLDQVEGGYDHNYVLDHGQCDEPRPSAEVRDPASGRRLEVFTTEPGVQLYTGNFLDGVAGKDGAVYQQHGGLCLETQHFPDSPNRPEFPSILLRPVEVYRQTTEYRLSTY